MTRLSLSISMKSLINNLKPWLNVITMGRLLLTIAVMGSYHQTLAQVEIDLAEEFDGIFFPLDRVQSTVCGEYHNWNPETVQPLFRDQLNLFRAAYIAASMADDDGLRAVVTRSDTYLDMYGFISNVRQLANSDEGIKYMYQEKFDESIEQHRLLGQNFLSEKPDVIVGIFWCQPAAGGGAPRFTGGYAYLRVVDGEWKFHTR